MSSKSLGKLELVGIFALYFTLCDFSVITPGLASFAAHFDTTPYTTILLANTITGVITVFTSAIAGVLIDRYGGYRRMAVIGIAIATLSGMAPFLFPNLEEYLWIIVSRVMVGFGLGLVNPLGGALIIRYFKGKKRAFMLGVGNMVYYAGGIAYQVAGGFFCNLGWNYTFLGYLVAIVPLLCIIFFLKEPEKEALTADNSRFAEPHEKEPMPKAIYGYTFLSFLVPALCLGAVFITSSIFEAANMGDPGVASIVMSMQHVGGMIAGLCFAVFLAVFRRKTAAIMCLFGALGFFIMFQAIGISSTVLYGVGITILGIAYIGVFTVFQNCSLNLAPPSRVASTNGILMAALNFGAFAASYFVSLCADVIYFNSPIVSFAQIGGHPMPLLALYVCAMIGLLVLAVVTFFMPFKSLNLPAKGEAKIGLGDSEDDETVPQP